MALIMMFTQANFLTNLKKMKKEEISRRAIATFLESAGEPQHFSSI